MTSAPKTEYGSKEQLLQSVATSKQVLHVGAVGCTLQPTEEKLAAARNSVHALLSRISTCVGLDIDIDGVKALTDAGIFDNLIAGDVESLQRDQIPLSNIDVIVAGDVIEHLSNPGLMLDSLYRLSDPETQLVVTTPNAMGLPNFLRYSLDRFAESPDHVCSFNEFSLTNLLRRHGWVLRQLHTCHQLGARQRNSRALYWAGNRLFGWKPRFGGTLFAIAQRSSRAVSFAQDPGTSVSRM